MLQGTNSELAGLTGSVTSEKKKKKKRIQKILLVLKTLTFLRRNHTNHCMYTDKDAAGARYAKWNSMSEVELNYSLQ